MELELTWADAEDGIELVNDTMDSLIKEAAERRQQTLDSHYNYVHSALGAAQTELNSATTTLLTAMQDAQSDRAAALGKGGGGIEDAKSLAAQLSSTESRLEELDVTRASIEQQLARLDQQVQSSLEQAKRVAAEPRLQYVEESAKRIRKGHREWQELQELYEQLSELLRENVESKDGYLAWKQRLVSLGPTLLPPATSFETAETLAVTSRLDSLLSRQERLQIELIPLDNRKALYNSRLKGLKADIDSVGATGAGTSPLGEDFGSRFLREERELEAAESKFAALTRQLDNIKLIRDSQAQEFVVETKAGTETVVEDSNKKKLFVLFFAASMAVLAMPVFGLEWLAARESPVARFAGRWGLPVIAERLLSNYSIGKGDAPDWRFDEAVRMTTLRIQQCANKSGFVVLMSNLAKAPPPVRLMSAIAECLAHREERVLIVDAMCPSHSRIPAKARGQHKELERTKGLVRPEGTSNPKAPPENGKSAAGASVPAVRQFGLSDFLSRECDEAADLIQPTSCPGVDQISAGDVDFPHEAMASSCITELFEHCRKTYSIILVAGPPVTARADFQLLAARADGIMLAANRAAVSDPANRAAVQDLIELQAPMLGVVG
ncbi:hypothetical protein NG895_15780 [Aeoliella sp. ICT_H6.2]|uniref:Cryptic autophosphorylating protein tyrosine kinase Etk n=1 Tax=Aeoliella straminimaris TaxID=2954799 RepID=A0A9X2JGU4_9BACT|nr:hypothetical protein [Aeoliella straminimaris]MCO6045370.1 hypothetical protein [Aeoliella straminimaris]